jgi:hypothetical protein
MPNKPKAIEDEREEERKRLAWQLYARVNDAVGSNLEAVRGDTPIADVAKDLDALTLQKWGGPEGHGQSVRYVELGRRYLTLWDFLTFAEVLKIPAVYLLLPNEDKPYLTAKGEAWDRRRVLGILVGEEMASFLFGEKDIDDVKARAEILGAPVLDDPLAKMLAKFADEEVK